MDAPTAGNVEPLYVKPFVERLVVGGEPRQVRGVPDSVRVRALARLAHLERLLKPARRRPRHLGQPLAARATYPARSRGCTWWGCSA